MRALPTLEPRRAALETCVFCPKLCRSACPVSNAEPRETITPWGKMSLGWMAAHGDVPLDAAHAAPAWACTGCFACREACDHRNAVADVLEDARAAFVHTGVAPEGVRRTLAHFHRHERRTRAAAQRLAANNMVDANAKDAVLVGCGYLRGAPREAADAVAASAALVGGRVALVQGCCGLPLRLAGDAAAFARHAREFTRSLDAYTRVLVADAGCGFALRRRYLDAGVRLTPRVEMIVEAAARDIHRLAPIARTSTEAVRWHDPCQLARGLGLYDAPRTVLTRALGRPPDELEHRREQAVCCGAGGLLPASMPAVARTMTQSRLAAHRDAGGGRVVTACASSVLAMRRAGALARIAVDDLVSWIAGALAEGRR